MKNPGESCLNSSVRVSMSHTVSTEMSWHVCVPVGSSSSTTRRLRVEEARCWEIWSCVSAGYAGGN